MPPGVAPIGARFCSSWSRLNSGSGTPTDALLLCAREHSSDVQDESDTTRLIGESRATAANARVLSEYSRQLLEGVAALHRLEARKRRLDIGSPEFEEVAAEITHRAQEIYLLAAEQQRTGAYVAKSDMTIEDIDPRSPTV